MKARLIVRGFLHGVKQFESQLTVNEETMADVVAEMASSHAAAMNDGTLGMVEFEFPDDPPDDRFFRIGVETAGMVTPVEIDLGKPPA